MNSNGDKTEYIRSVWDEILFLWIEVSVDPFPALRAVRRWAKTRTLTGDRWHDACDFLDFSLGEAIL